MRLLTQSHFLFSLIPMISPSVRVFTDRKSVYSYSAFPLLITNINKYLLQKTGCFYRKSDEIAQVKDLR